MKPEIEPYPTLKPGDKVVFKERMVDPRRKIHCIEKITDHDYITGHGQRFITLKLVGRKKEVNYQIVRLVGQKPKP